mmetsp:Transcript_24944/g.48794  ORF Transcript_24944/g.48794 Transcript_24944/m.48794 type:complete len:102 (+) Transcript_24944:103-408(+)
MSYSIIDRDAGPDPNYPPPPKGAYKGKYEECYKFYDEYNKCHEENRFGRIFGACSSFKSAMDKCNIEQLNLRRKRAAKEAKTFNEKFDKLQKAMKDKEGKR